MRKPNLVRDVTPDSAGSNGACVHCGKQATKEMMFNSDSIVIIERYCDVCSEPTMFTRLQEWYSRLAS